MSGINCHAKVFYSVLTKVGHILIYLSLAKRREYCDVYFAINVLNGFIKSPVNRISMSLNKHSEHFDIFTVSRSRFKSLVHKKILE